MLAKAVAASHEGAILLSYVELTPLLAAELEADLATEQALWLRGGYPLAPGVEVVPVWDIERIVEQVTGR